jgi:hypothetical protein
MPADRRFHTVTLRAVDDMEAALPAARARTATGGQLAILTTIQISSAGRTIALPNSKAGVLYLETV